MQIADAEFLEGDQAINRLSKYQASCFKAAAFCEATHIYTRIRVVARDAHESLDQANALVISTFGRFGNLIRQISNAIDLANLLGISHIYFDASAQGDVFITDGSLKTSGVEISPSIPSDISIIALVATFWDLWSLLADDAMPRMKKDLCNSQDMRQLMHHDVLQLADMEEEEFAAIHFRGGDIFYLNPPNPEYIQPPLAFYYQAALLARKEYSSPVRIVHEDERNPVLHPFIEKLQQNQIPFSQHSGSLAQDLGLLFRASSIVSSYGTFIPTVARLSCNVRRVVGFQNPHLDDLKSRWRNDLELTQYSDLTGNYIKVGDWFGTEEQKLMMVDYPASSVIKRPL